MLVSRHQNTGKIHDKDIAFENVKQLIYFVTTVTYQNVIQDEVNLRLKSCNTWYCSIQNLLSSRLLS
jgi:hypothetical protein